MKFVFNTNYESADKIIFVDDLSQRLKNTGHETFFNDWKNYERYDFTLFLSPDSDVRTAKKLNPKIIAGIMDPKISSKEKIQEIKAADFLVVGSLEAMDTFLKYNRNVFIHYGFPDIKEIKKVHKEKDKILIGYHGNKLHLHCMYPTITTALEELNEKYDIEFWAMYNIESLGKWDKFLPKAVKIRHIQWSIENYYNELAKCDIGIVPNTIPIDYDGGLKKTKLKDAILSRILSIPKLAGLSLLVFRNRNLFGYSDNDYLLRFKYTSNPGRVYIFSQLHIPVISDFFISISQVIQHGYSGFLANSKEGWYLALESLIKSPKLRNKMSLNLKRFINENISIDINFNRFIEFITSLKKMEEI